MSDTAASPVDVGHDVGELASAVIALRRALHRYPELAFEEVRTAALLAAAMRSLDLCVDERVGGTGVVATLEGARAGRTLLIRADMDALPIPDATGREYASVLPDRHHACGHDAHAAVVAGVASALARHRARIAGRVVFVFQPADEPMRGARRMIDDGLLDRVQPDMSVSLHVLPMARVGQVVVQRGPLWASWDTRRLTIAGPVPSADRPAPIDIARLAARITTALYDLVDREGRSPEPVTFRVRSLVAEQPGPGDPAQAAVEVHLGRAGPPRAVLELNLAVYDNALRVRLLDRMEAAVAAIVETAGGSWTCETDHAIPAVVNDTHVTATLARAARHVVGEANVLTGWRHRFADDVALFLTAAPGCLMLLGTANPGRGITEIWHRPGFDIDEAALPIAVHVISLAALDLLQ